MTPGQAALVERIRALVADGTEVREVSMFGGRSIMVHGKMLVSVRKDGGLLVRVDAEQHDRLLDRPGEAQAKMGPGREMGPGWIRVSAEAIDDDDQLAAWIEVAMDHNRAVTGGDA